MSWTFVQSTGELISPAGGLFAQGYSGAVGFKNNPRYQDIKDKGPLPCGWYTIGEPHDSPHTGPYTLDLTPDTSNEMFGRDEFRIHGDSVSNPGTASDGCIIAPRFARERIWESNDHRIQVVSEPEVKA